MNTPPTDSTASGQPGGAGPAAPLRVIDLGRMAYASAAAVQAEHLERIASTRDHGPPERGVVLLVEHDPVITVSNRPGAACHVLASADVLGAAGVALERTDRGGDVTYHGPGQLVVYPIVDLAAHGLRVVDHVRLLEGAIIAALESLGVSAMADPTATGVWIPRDGRPHAKVAAIGVRVRRWVSMHGLAINVRPDLSHFGLIVPCGLHGRPVTSLERELGPAAPAMERVKSAIVTALLERFDASHARAASGSRGGEGTALPSPSTEPA